MTRFTSDFETVTWLENETWVWAWATCNIDNNEDICYGNDIESFIDYCYNNKNSLFLFHNLKFDGEFIISYLLSHNYTWVKDKKEATNNSFTTLISDMGQFYEIVIYFKVGNKKVHKVTFHDSLKIIPFSVAEVAKYFNLDIGKLELDYNTPREKGHILTSHEKYYIKNDVLIMAKALKVIFDNGLTKMTRAGNALFDFRKTMTQSKFEHFFPDLSEIDEDIRQSYKGGFTYLNPLYKEKEVGEGIVLDVNSLYPFVLCNV